MEKSLGLVQAWSGVGQGKFLNVDASIQHHEEATWSEIWRVLRRGIDPLSVASSPLREHSPAWRSQFGLDMVYA